MELVVLGVVALVLLLRYPVHFALHPPFLMDFEVYWSAAHRLVTGDIAALYAPTTLGSDRMTFKYAPVWALAWAPFGALPKPAAAVLWTAAGVAALMATLAVSARFCRSAGLRTHPLLALPAVFLIVRPLAEEMGNGQVNALWGLLVVAGAWAASQRRRSASAAFAGAMLLKLPAAVYLPYLAARRRHRLALAAAVIACGAAALSSALLWPARPLHLLQAWRHAVAGSAQTAFEIGNQSAAALLSRLLTGDGYGLNVAALPRALVPWLAAALLLVCWWLVAAPSRRRTEPAWFVYDCAMLSILMVLFSPSGWLATYTVLLFPAYVAAAGLAQPAARRDGAAWALAWLVASLTLLTHRSTWRLLGLTSWRGETYLFLVFMILPWMGLALLALLWRLRRLHGRRPA